MFIELSSPENKDLISYNVCPLHTLPKRSGEVEGWPEIDKEALLAPSTRLIMFIL